MAFSKTSLVGAMVGAAGLACFFAIRAGSAGSAMPVTVNEASVTNTAATGLVEAGSRRSLNGNTVPSVIGAAPSESSAWKNDLNVVHVIHTDFMTHQANLKHLGAARLDLFKTFTLPSMMRQSNQQFLWLVWTDGELKKEVLGEFLELVAPLRNVVVISAERVPETNLRTMFGHQKTSLAWLREVVLSGDVELLSEYYQASQSHLLLETNLDSDDALSYKFIETVQAEAAYTIGQDLEDDLERVETFCPEYHAEWRYFAPENSVSDEGHLVQVHNQKFCIGSGSSVAFHVKAKAHRVLCDEVGDHPFCDRRSLADRQLCNKEPRKLAELEYGNNSMCEEQVIPEGAQNILYSPLNKNDPDSVCPEGSFICEGKVDGEYDSMYLFTADGVADVPAQSAAVFTCVPEFCQQHVLYFDVIVQSKNITTGLVTKYLVDYLGAKSYQYPLVCDPYLTDIDYKMTRTYSEIPGSSDAQINQWSPTLPGPNDDLVHGTHIVSYHTVDGLDAHAVCVAPVDPITEHRICLRNLRLLPSEEDNSVKKLDASVLLARTPTAAGMKSVMPDKGNNNDEQKNSVVLSTYGDIKSEAQAKAWESMETNFGITHDDVTALRARMEDNMEHILLDAFNGQCTPGHSCADSTKRALGKLLDNVSN